MTLPKDFVSTEQREYKMKMGSTIASALTGFVAGVISASVIFYIVLEIVKNGVGN